MASSKVSEARRHRRARGSDPCGIVYEAQASYPRGRRVRSRQPRRAASYASLSNQRQIIFFGFIFVCSLLCDECERPASYDVAVSPSWRWREQG